MVYHSVWQPYIRHLDLLEVRNTFGVRLALKVCHDN